MPNRRLEMDTVVAGLIMEKDTKISKCMCAKSDIGEQRMFVYLTLLCIYYEKTGF